LAGNTFLEKLGIQYPIIQAPMAGGFTTPQLVAAVSNSGGLGSLGAAYLTPEQIRESVREIRALTDKPFNVNLFCGGYDANPRADSAPMMALLAEIHKELEIAAPVLPVVPPDPFPQQVVAVLEAHPAVFSFTFGMPGRDVIARLKARGIVVLGTATTVEEARILAEAGVDAVVAQGTEAGAHRGTFEGPFEQAMVPTMELVRAAVGTAWLPIIAAGGIMDGRDVAAAMALGASAAQMGTAFLPCPESGASEVHKLAILKVREDNTVITRAFSGRHARGIANAFTAMFDGKEEAILSFPQQNALTRAMRNAAAKRGDERYVSLWAGQGAARARAMPAAKLVSRLVEEMAEAGR
jgi:nitronate monooxygenase